MKMKIAFFAAVVFLSGCVTGTRNIELAPPPIESSNKASGTIYIGQITDSRGFEAKPASPSTPSVNGDLTKTPKDKLNALIGRQRNGYGKAMGDVALPAGGTVQNEMRELLVAGLESRGYKVTDDKNAAVAMDVDIEKFWAWFSPGMWAVSFESQLECKINVTKSGKDKELKVAGYGLNKGQVASDANWVLAYQRAFEDFLKNFDKALDDAGM